MLETHKESFPGFTLIAPSIWEYLPNSLHSLERVATDISPDLLILFSWTGARKRHVLRYVRSYQSLFPLSRILVITTTIEDLCFHSSAVKQSRLQPAVEQIVSYVNVTRILVHVFSEGGANKAVELAEAYHHHTGTRLPCSAMLLDSTPGLPRYLRLCNALQLSLAPHPVVQTVGLILGAILLAFFWCLYICIQKPENNIISQTRRRLVDDLYWDMSAPRCYLYSKSDKLIAWEDIHAHSVEATSKKIPVTNVCFEMSEHCKHVAASPTIYWNAVTQIWNQALVKELG
jgi:hypothetical protein